MRSYTEGGKTALVLAGGGLTGAVYEMGALRAINDLLVDRTVNDFDIYVGTSAGALVSAMLANGISPQAMIQSLDGSYPGVREIQRGDIFNISRTEMTHLLARLPQRVAQAWYHYLRHLDDMTFFDFVWSLSDVLPAGIYDGMALERYLRQVILKLGRSNRFKDLEKDLFIVATDLDSGKRKVFSRRDEVPITYTVAASSAIPLVYKPVRIEGRDYVDGSLRGNASIDVAIEHGASLVVCINPMVPFNNSNLHAIHDADPESEFTYLSERGTQFVFNQATRIVTYSTIHYHIKQLRRSNPQVDIILIEPRGDDYQMFFYNPMRYSARLTIARHGFESVTLGLAEDYAMYRDALGRHGIPMTRRLVIQELMRIRQSDYAPEVIREILESRSAGCSENKDSPVCRLTRTLAELELMLDEVG